MFEKDWDILNGIYNERPIKNSFEENEDYINPYTDVKNAQRKCRHMWDNDTDAIYSTAKGRKKCAICGKQF